MARTTLHLEDVCCLQIFIQLKNIYEDMFEIYLPEKSLKITLCIELIKLYVTFIVYLQIHLL